MFVSVGNNKRAAACYNARCRNTRQHFYNNGCHTPPPTCAFNATFVAFNVHRAAVLAAFFRSRLFLFVFAFFSLSEKNFHFNVFLFFVVVVILCCLQRFAELSYFSAIKRYVLNVLCYCVFLMYYFQFVSLTSRLAYVESECVPNLYH